MEVHCPVALVGGGPVQQYLPELTYEKNGDNKMQKMLNCNMFSLLSAQLLLNSFCRQYSEFGDELKLYVI